MSNLAFDDDAAGQTEPIDAELPQPAVHGQVHVSAAHNDPQTLQKQMRTHLAEHERHLAATAAYHRPTVNAAGDSGESSQGAMSPGGASGADYQTTSEGSVGDADSGGASGY